MADTDHNDDAPIEIGDYDEAAAPVGPHRHGGPITEPTIGDYDGPEPHPAPIYDPAAGRYRMPHQDTDDASRALGGAAPKSAHRDRSGAEPLYEVGRGRPPREHQFEKGRSGNPAGRPKASLSWKTLVREELARLAPIPGQESMTMAQLMARQLVTLGGKGDLRAMKMIAPLLPEKDEEKSLPFGHREVTFVITPEEIELIERIKEEHGAYFSGGPGLTLEEAMAVPADGYGVGDKRADEAERADPGPERGEGDS